MSHWSEELLKSTSVLKFAGESSLLDDELDDQVMNFEVGSMYSQHKFL